MKLDAFCERYCLDARSFEEKNARSLALGKERLAAGKTGQAMRLFAYNHALNQNKQQSNAPSKPTAWKVRVWKNNKVVKTMTVEKDDEGFVTQKVKGLGIDWDKATVHDPKTMKQQKSYKNANATKGAPKAPAANASSAKASAMQKAAPQKTVNSAVVRFTFEDPFGDDHSFEEKVNFAKPVNKNEAISLAKKELMNGIDLKNETKGGMFNNFHDVTLSFKGKRLGIWKDSPPFSKFIWKSAAFTNENKGYWIKFKEVKV